MDKKKVKTKEYTVTSEEENDIDLALVNELTLDNVTREDIYTFSIICCDNEIDRVYDCMGEAFLKEFAKRAKGLTILQNHEWDVENQSARVYQAEYVEDTETLTQLGETRKYVLAKVYTLSKYEDYIDKIKAGLLKEVSVSFESKRDTCSICGAETEKGSDDKAICPNDHIMGETYEGKICCNMLNTLTDVFECSFVAVPCQRGAGIKNKSLEGGIGIMKKSMFMLQKLINSKAFKDADTETQDTIKGLMEDSDTEKELSPEDIKGLLEENAKLKESVECLKAKLKETEVSHTQEKIKSKILKEIEEMNPLTPTVADNMLKEIDLGTLKMEGDNIEGLDELFKGLKERYKGLIADEEDKGLEEEDKDLEEEEKGLEDETPEETLKRLKSKANKSNRASTIKFSVGDSKSTTKGKQVTKSSLSFR